MSTTTIRLPDDLKTRVAVAAKRASTTAHSFILEAIAEKTAQDERRSEFHALADRRYSEILSSGMTIPWNEMRRYLKQRVAGRKATRPTPRKLTR